MTGERTRLSLFEAGGLSQVGFLQKQTELEISIQEVIRGALGRSTGSREGKEEGLSRGTSPAAIKSQW